MLTNITFAQASLYKIRLCAHHEGCDERGINCDSASRSTLLRFLRNAGFTKMQIVVGEPDVETWHSPDHCVGIK